MPIAEGRLARRVSVALLVILSGALTASFRFLAIDGFNNDHFVHLSAAQQMLFGDWPTRDFVDPGRPLTIVASAAAQYLLGHTLFAEAVLVSAAFGTAAALTAVTVFELTNSLSVSFGAAAFEAAIFPRTYHYPKLLVTAAGLWLIVYFLRRPSFTRQMMMAAGVTIAFLFRHDLGLFVGVGGLVASILAAPTAPWRQRSRCGMGFAAMIVVMVAPYLAYVQLTGGLWNYVITALDYDQGHPGYVWPNPLTAGASAESQLLYLFHLLPVATLGVLATDWKRCRDCWCTSFLISVVFVAVAENFGLMWDSLEVRVPDAVVPAVVLGAWLAHRAWLAGPRYLLPSTVVLLGAGFLIGSLGNVREQLGRAGLTGQIWLQPGLLPVRFAERSAALHERFGNHSPSRAASTLHRFFLYLDRCTTEQHRLFPVGMLPEVAYLAQRPFEGGGYERYNFGSRINQQRVVDRLRRQLVPFALITSGSAAELDVKAPIVAGYLRGRYVLLADLPLVEDERIKILIDDTLPSMSRDTETGWPCFK